MDLRIEVGMLKLVKLYQLFHDYIWTMRCELWHFENFVVYNTCDWNFCCSFHCIRLTFKKYKTFSVLIYSYINTSGNWKNEKLCGNTTPEGRSVFTQFRVFPIFTSVDITIYQHGKCFIFFL